MTLGRTRVVAAADATVDGSHLFDCVSDKAHAIQFAYYECGDAR
jgi:hypothetical protein